MLNNTLKNPYEFILLSKYLFIIEIIRSTQNTENEINRVYEKIYKYTFSYNPFYCLIHLKKKKKVISIESAFARSCSSSNYEGSVKPQGKVQYLNRDEER